MSFDIDVVCKRGDFELTVAFQAGPGLTALFGPSGAGKTSVLNMIAGVLKPARGRIAADVAELSDADGLRPARVRGELHADLADLGGDAEDG